MSGYSKEGAFLRLHYPSNRLKVKHFLYKLDRQSAQIAINHPSAERSRVDIIFDFKIRVFSLDQHETTTNVLQLHLGVSCTATGTNLYSYWPNFH